MAGGSAFTHYARHRAQNKLVAAAAQLPLDWANDADQASPPNPSTRQGMGAAPNGSANGSARSRRNAAARGTPSIQNAQAARFVAGEVLASSLSDLNGQPAHSSLHSAAAQPADGGASQIRNRWQPRFIRRPFLWCVSTRSARHRPFAGLAKRGRRQLDWTIEQEGDEWDRSGGGTASEDGQPWRTRLTLSLPTLGTVDADLTLTGMRLVARVQASPAGAARLAVQGENFRERLAAAGIEMNGLTIREIGGGAPATAANAGLRRPLRRRRRRMRGRLRRAVRRIEVVAAGRQRCRTTGSRATARPPHGTRAARRFRLGHVMSRKHRRSAAALVYDAQGGDPAPRVIAKGYGMLAEMIVQRAKEAGLYVHEAPEMVSLLMQVDLDARIPPQLYQAVAEMLAWLHRLESGAENEPPQAAEADAQDVIDVVATEIEGGPQPQRRA